MIESRQIDKIPLGMRPGLRALNQASLRVSMCEAVPAEMRDHVREITEMFTNPHCRRRRLGTMLLNMVCQEADANKMTLVLTAYPFDIDDSTAQSLSMEQLTAWYQSFGFVKLQDGPRGPIMARKIFKGSPIIKASVSDILASVH